MKTVNLILISFLISSSLSAAVNFVTNGNFETNTQGWSPFNNNGTQIFALDASSPIIGNNSAKITVTNGTSNGTISENWRLGIRWGMSTFKSGRYLVHFKARASRNLQLVSMFQQNFSPYSSWGYVEWNLTTTVQDFDVILENNSGGVGGYWAFVLYYGHLNTGDQVWIDDVRIEELVNSTSGVLTDGNICNGDFEADIANYMGSVSGWQNVSFLPANITFSTDNTNSISRVKSFKATSISSGTEGWHSQLIWNFCPSFGMKYSIEFKAKATTPLSISAEVIDDWGGGRNNPLGFANFNITTDIQTFTCDYPNTVTQYDLYTFIFWLGLLPAGQSVWIDDVKIFRTSSPVLNPTTALTSITNVSAVSGGNVLSTDREITSRGVCWSTSQNPTIANSKTTDGTGNGTFSSSITELTPNTTYYVRSYATNSIGTSYGSQVSFTTLNEFTAVGTTSISSYSTLNASSVITVPSGTTLTVDNTTSLSAITVAPGAKLTVNDGVSLTATNGITLQNTASGTASFVDSRTADNPTAIAGTVEQAITETNRNWYVAVPVSGKPASDITLSGAKIVQRNEALSRWDDVLSGTILTPGVGYIAVASASSGTTSWSLNGNLNSGKVEVPVTSSGTSSTGFNLLGNPYPSYLNWEQVLNLNATNASLLQSSIWYRTKSGASYAFQTYNSAGRVATPTTTSGYIPPMQSFWVRANAAGTVTFTNAMRSHGDGASNKLKSPKANTQKIIRLQISNAVVTDEAVIYIDQNAQNSFDKYDTEKMFNNLVSQPELYTKANNENLVINGLNQLLDNQEIPLGFTYTQGGDLKLKLTEMNNFDSNTKLYLRDKVAITEIELLPYTEYAFNTSTTTNNESRFSLIYKVAGMSTGTTTPSNNRVSVFVNAVNQITIIAPEKSNYAIYNAVGQLIENGILNDKLHTVNYKLNTGVYVVKANNELTKVIIK